MSGIDWGILRWQLSQGSVVPIVSNSVRNDHVFKHVLGLAGSLQPGMTVDEYLADRWATQLGYPLPKYRKSLARVAQCNVVKNPNPPGAAAMKYLKFLKESLIECARQGDSHHEEDWYENLEQSIGENSFSDIVYDLGYLPIEPQENDSLVLLARINTLSHYVTTSYYDFLERALISQGRHPRTQICFWRGVPGGVRKEHQPDRGYLPTPEEPLVYHLFGHERYPSSLVLSESDYTDFLIEVSKRPDTQNPVLPTYLVAALQTSTAVLLGYCLRDLDFHTLFRGVIHHLGKQVSGGVKHLAIQLMPSIEHGVKKDDEAQAQAYLEQYFDRSSFDVEWGETDAFITKLHEQWKAGK
jgi:hypothetical protein